VLHDDRNIAGLRIFEVVEAKMTAAARRDVEAIRTHGISGLVKEEDSSVSGRHAARALDQDGSTD
jgi:hypothetical protein